MFVTIITDCCGGNDWGRQATRVASLTGVTPTLVPCTSGLATTDLEVGFNLVDQLDASGGREGFIIAQSSRRDGLGKRWFNGSPFCRFRYGETIVLASIAGRTLSFLKKLGIVESVGLFDIPSVLRVLIAADRLTWPEAAYIARTQFRSYEFLCRLVAWIFEEVEIPTEEKSLDAVESIHPGTICIVDEFGNVKLAGLPEELGHTPGHTIETPAGSVRCYAELCDVPNGELGLTIGSSGIWVDKTKDEGNKRFVELAFQGGRAIDRLPKGFTVGARLVNALEDVPVL